MNNIDIAIIINSFNRLSLLKECIGVLSAWLPYSDLNNRCVVVVYDAGSTDGSIDWLMEEAQQLGITLKVIVAGPGDDSSFSAGLNTAVACVEEEFTFIRYLLFYETDNQILAPQPIVQALDLLKQVDRLAAVGFTVRKHDGTPAGVGQPFPSLLNFSLGKNVVHRLQLEAIKYNWKVKAGIEYSEVDVVYTSPLLVRMDAWKVSGGMDAATFPFSDCDVDWARRLRVIGWSMGVIRSDVVIHDNKQVLSNWSRSRSLQAHRGRLKYFFRHSSIAVYAIWPALLLLRHLLELIAVKLIIKDPARRKQLSSQFWGLLKACPKRYEDAFIKEG
jgi:GT2 family glycosyltransferase